MCFKNINGHSKGTYHRVDTISIYATHFKQATLADTQTKAYLNSVAGNPKVERFFNPRFKKLYCCPTHKTCANEQERNGDENKARTANNGFMKLRGEVPLNILSSLYGFTVWDMAQVLNPQLHKAESLAAIFWDDQTS
jgi:hypothetical protein